MFEIADRLLVSLDAGRTLAVATAVAIEGSAPRTVGTSMAFDGSAVLGTIAGGCVEAAVVEVCERVLVDGRARTVEYGVSNEAAFSVGLTCGGRLRIHVQLVRPDDTLVESLRAADRGEAVGMAIVLGDVDGDVGSGEPADDPDDGRVGAPQPPWLASPTMPWLAARIDAEVRGRVANGQTGTSILTCDGVDVEVFVEVAVAPPRLVVIGAMDYSAALAAAARPLGYRVTVCDPRPLFATPARFPGVELVVAWPTGYLAATEIDARTAICVLSHDERFDTEVVALALASPAGYVGALGSRRTHDQRVDALRSKRVPDGHLARLRSPIGLDLGASTPQETAVSILAEILAVRAEASGAPLSTTTGSIHRPTAASPAIDALSRLG